MESSTGFGPEGDPLRSNSPDVWHELITAVGPASILVVIDSQLSTRLREYVSAEDVWQETLLLAWRDRATVEWRGVRAFRHWLLGTARHCIAHLAEEQSTVKRGGRVKVSAISTLEGSGEQVGYAGPFRTTTPSQVARDGEAAEAFQRVLRSLPEDLSEVVRLRLFEDLKIEEVAARVGLGVSGVRHRLRRGIALYRARLISESAADTEFRGKP